MNKRQWFDHIIRVGACVLALYLLWAHKLGVAGSLLVAVLGVMIGRSMNRDGRVPNLFGASRDYSLKPAGVALIKAAACFVLAMVWAVSIALAVRYGLLPDNAWTAYGLLGFPLIGLLSFFALFLGKALFWAQFGSKR